MVEANCVVDRYPSVPRPCKELVSCGVEIYPNKPRPFVVLVRSDAARPPPPPACPLIISWFAFDEKVMFVPATKMVEL